MPICNKPPPALGNIKSATEIDDHASEAAKVKRTREQAYFNSYNFDAIEALPYDDDDDDDDEEDDGVGNAAQATGTDATLSYRNSNSHASNPPSAALHALNANSRQRLPNASLSSKSHSSSSDRSSSGPHSASQRSYNGLNAVVDYVGLHSGNAKCAYLQRLDTLLVRPQHAAHSECGRAATLTRGEQALARSITQVNLQQETADNGSFLLPRAMLKYQSVGSTNSMPLAVIATLHATGPATADKLLLNGNSGSNSNSGSGGGSGSTSTSKYSSQATMMLTNNGCSSSNSNGNSNGNGSRNSHIAISSAANAAMRPNGKIRLNYANSNDNYSGLLMAVNKDTTTATTSTLTATSTAITAAATTAARIKKQSTSSTATASSGSAEHELPSSQQSAGARGRNSNSATALATAAAESARRGRTSSHQSHYSTDKSGSSGYYSSNVCSTYSLEDHIYSEPVIDVLDVGSKSKSGIGGVQSLSKHIATTTTAATTKTKAKPVQNIATAAGEMQRNNSRVRDMNDAAQGKRFAFQKNGGVDLATRGSADDAADDEGDDEDGARARHASRKMTPDLPMVLRRGKSPSHQPPTQHFSENLRILETSIENLDRHLKNFPSLSSQERIAAFVQSHHTYLQLPGCADAGERLGRAHSHLPTIMEGYDPANQPRPWPDDMVDDSLLDIDLDSFLLVDERRASKRGKSAKAPMADRRSDGGIDNPNFLTDEQEENNYKCAKYINSCPEDAYRVESDIVAGNGTGTGTGTGPGTGTGTGSGSEKSIALVDHYLKRYEDQLHFQSTRELLEDVRDKIRLLSQSRSSGGDDGDGDLHANSRNDNAAHSAQLPVELEGMIKTLKLELETYLSRMNQHSELEIRQLCSGLVKNQNIVKMKKAFERRRSTHSIGAIDSDYGYAGGYEAISDGALVSASGVPLSIREQIASIRCASDPNFKMKRKSLTEVFPDVGCCIEPTPLQPTEQRRSARSDRSKTGAIRVVVQLPYAGTNAPTPTTAAATAVVTQMQRNLSFQQPILNKLEAKAGVMTAGSSVRIELGGRGVSSGGAGGGSSNGSGAESAESGDKDSILEWHRKKPSIWELYYGTNRMNQSLLGKRNGMVVNSSQATMSYPSSRPESDFTLDLPRAEQLRIKMEKEKKFRQRCRYITTFLSLVFFLLTVMVVSLVLTRGKRMFGSMI